MVSLSLSDFRYRTTLVSGSTHTVSQSTNYHSYILSRNMPVFISDLRIYMGREEPRGGKLPMSTKILHYDQHVKLEQSLVESQDMKSARHCCSSTVYTRV